MLPTSIDTLKSTIGRRGGVARGNRFAIYMTHPNKKQGLLNTDFTGLASNVLTSVVNGGSVDPMAFFNDPRDMFLLCDSVQFPGKQINTSERNTTHKSVKMAYGYQVSDVTFSFLLTNDYYIKKYFDSWQDMIVSGKDLNVAYKEDYTTDIVIQQITQGNDFIPAYSVKLLNAYPTAVTGVDLSNANADLLRVSITVSFDDWEEESLLDSASSVFDMGKDLLGATGTQISGIVDGARNFFN